MRRTTTLFLLVFAIAGLQAQNYLITFAGTGSSTTVDSVKIQNNTKCIDTTIGGTDILDLTSVLTGINELNNNADNALQVFPNPTTGTLMISFFATSSGNAIIELYDMTGKRILQSQDLLSIGNQSYILKGIGSGIYLIKIKSDDYSYTSKIVCHSEAVGKPEISRIGTIQGTNGQNTIVKNEKINNIRSGSTIQMLFDTGDTLKLTGKSGNFRNVIMLFPASSQTVTFTFVNCTDADSNHYAVVQIGTQLWMEENLKTTKFRDGSAIPNLADSALWHNATTAAYCDYHNLASEGQHYGHLYNWWAADTSLNVAPVGWHVANDSEWTVLSNFLGGDSKAGRKMKEGCQTRWAYLADSNGNNASGFTALCTNFRNGKGANIDWSMAPNNDHDSFLWTSTNASSTTAYVTALRYCYTDLWRCSCVSKAMGAVIRCVHD